MKFASIAAAALMLALGLAGSTILWTRINSSRDAEAGLERAGLDSLERKENARAIRLLETAAHMKTAPVRAWYNLGIAYQHAKKYDEALTAYEHAAGMPGADAEIQKAAREMKEYRVRKKEYEFRKKEFEDRTKEYEAFKQKMETNTPH